MPDPHAVPLGLLIVGGCAGAGVLGITAAAVWLGFWGLGTPADRAAANQTLQLTAGLLGGRFRDRRDYPGHQRPSQFGGVEGELGDLSCELFLMPRNAEDCAGAAMLRIYSRQGRQLTGGKHGLLFFTPEEVWHWPDRADPGTLAGYVRQHLADAASGGAPPAGA